MSLVESSQDAKWYNINQAKFKLSSSKTNLKSDAYLKFSSYEKPNNQGKLSEIECVDYSTNAWISQPDKDSLIKFWKNSSIEITGLSDKGLEKNWKIHFVEHACYNQLKLYSTLTHRIRA